MNSTNKILQCFLVENDVFHVFIDNGKDWFQWQINSDFEQQRVSRVFNKKDLVRIIPKLMELGVKLQLIVSSVNSELIGDLGDLIDENDWGSIRFNVLQDNPYDVMECLASPDPYLLSQWCLLIAGKSSTWALEHSSPEFIQSLGIGFGRWLSQQYGQSILDDLHSRVWKHEEFERIEQNDTERYELKHFPLAWFTLTINVDNQAILFESGPVFIGPTILDINGTHIVASDANFSLWTKWRSHFTSINALNYKTTNVVWLVHPGNSVKNLGVPTAYSVNLKRSTEERLDLLASTDKDEVLIMQDDRVIHQYSIGTITFNLKVDMSDSNEIEFEIETSDMGCESYIIDFQPGEFSTVEKVELSPLADEEEVLFGSWSGSVEWSEMVVDGITQRVIGIEIKIPEKS